MTALTNAWHNSEGNGKRQIQDVTIEDYLRQTSTLHLPQTKILIDMLENLKESGLQEAYLRGSFSCGEADESSDIDLFLVVEPERLEEVYKAFIENFQKTHHMVVHCYDRIVPDYGGLGFTFMGVDEEGKYLLFDMYLALKGIPPNIPTIDWPRVFTKDPQYCWFDEHADKPQLPENTRKFIARFTENDDKTERARLLFSDFLVVLSTLHKHASRGQIGRCLNDNNHLITVATELLVDGMDVKAHQSALWLVDKLVNMMTHAPDGDINMIGDMLRAELRTAPSPEKIDRFYDLVTAIMQKFSPEILAEMEAELALFENNVIHYGAPPPLPGSEAAPAGPSVPAPH